MKTAILHYTAPGVIGGVEAVIQAHARQFAARGLPLAVIAGRGDPAALPEGVELILVPEIDSQHPAVLQASAQLERGILPENFAAQVDSLTGTLRPLLAGVDRLIVHNVFSKHFNLPLTAALLRLLDEGTPASAIAWCHDLTWTSESSRRKVHDGYPWNLLKTPHPRLRYVAVSMQRQMEVGQSFGLPADQIAIIYNGVDPAELLGLSPQGAALVERLDLWSADLALLMPVRVTRAKNIEYALEFVAELRRMGCDARLVLTGPPDPHDENSMSYYRQLLDLRARLGLEKHLRFVYESGPQPGQGYLIDASLVSELYRVCDVMFLPSHHEGFGMPVLEAGLRGMPVICTAVPAALEIALEDAFVFPHHTEAERLAMDVLEWVEDDPTLRLRKRVRREYTWEAIFEHRVLPLLEGRST